MLCWEVSSWVLPKRKGVSSVLLSSCFTSTAVVVVYEVHFCEIYDMTGKLAKVILRLVPRNYCCTSRNSPNFKSGLLCYYNIQINILILFNTDVLRDYFIVKFLIIFYQYNCIIVLNLCTIPSIDLPIVEIYYPLLQLIPLAVRIQQLFLDLILIYNHYLILFQFSVLLLMMYYLQNILSKLFEFLYHFHHQHY